LTDPKKKDKPVVKTRPAGKLPSGFDKVGRKPDGGAVADILGLNPPEPGAARPPRPSTPSTDSSPSVAPARDFTRTANSIVREAVPFGVFGGKSKQLYDYLYSQTRGAMVPVRSVRLTKLKLMAGADIGSEVTLKKNLDRLKGWGLISEKIIPGVYGGNEYTVYLPEEATPPRGSTPSRESNPLYKVEPLEPLETTPSSPSLIVELQGTSELAKTSFKTKEEKIDDEAFAGLVSLLKQAAEEVTGREPSAAERERWNEVAELLVTELKIAAARTTVSSAPAFLAEHLRRRLRKADSNQIEREVEEAASGAKAQAPPRPELTHEQVQEQANLVSSLLRDGAIIEELEEQFAGNFRPSQWHMIRSIALAQAKISGAPAKPDETEA
jgi:hypothetical protein